MPRGHFCFLFFFFPSPNMFTTSTLSPLFLQLALRAPSNLSKGRDCVSSVHSTVAPPLRRPRSAAAATAITAATWTNRRTCAPVSHVQYRRTRTVTLHEPFQSVTPVSCTVSNTPNGATVWTGITSRVSVHIWRF